MAQAQAQAPAKTAAPATTAAPANGSSVAASAVTGGQGKGKGKDPELFEGADDHFALMELDANKLRERAGVVKKRRTAARWWGWGAELESGAGAGARGRGTALDK